MMRLKHNGATRTIITLVGLALGKIFISRLAPYSAMNA